jgi:hypothetical protein
MQAENNHKVAFQLSFTQNEGKCVHHLLAVAVETVVPYLANWTRQLYNFVDQMN